MVFGKLVESTVFALFVFVRYGYYALRDAYVLKLPPSFAGDELVDALAPGVPCAEEGRVLLGVGDVVEDFWGQD